MYSVKSTALKYKELCAQMMLDFNKLQVTPEPKLFSLKDLL